MLPDPSLYTRDSVGPLTYLNAVRALAQSEVTWKTMCHRYMDGTTAGACAVEVNGGSPDAFLMCEVWDYMERMPEPTDMPMQLEWHSLLHRLRKWGEQSTLRKE